MLRNSKTILFYLTISCLLTPFLVSPNTYFPFIIAKATAFRLIVEAMLVVWVFWLVKSRTSKGSPISSVSLTPLTKAVIIFGIIIFISAFLGVNFYYSFFSSNERMEGVFGIWHFLIYFFILIFTFNRQEIERLLKIQVGISVFYCALSLLAYEGIGPITTKFTFSRFAGYTGNPSYFAAYLIFNAFLALYFYFQEYQLNKKLFNWWLAIFTFESILIFMTGTRGGMVGYFSAMLLTIVGMVFGLKSKELLIFKKISSGVFLIAVIVLIILFGFKNSAFIKKNMILERLTSISLSDPTAVSRILSAKIAWRSFLEKPLFGWGLENYEAAYLKNFDKAILKVLPADYYFDRAHNKPMEVLATTGIFGFISYLSIFVFSLFSLYKKSRREGWFLASLVLAAILVGYFIQNIFLFDFHESYLMFFLILAFLAVIFSEDSEDLENQGEEKTESNKRNFLKRKEATDYSLKMENYLLLTIVFCATAVSLIKWVINPYFTSRDIFYVNYFIKKQDGEKALWCLNKAFYNPGFLKEDVVMGVKKGYSEGAFNLSTKKEIVTRLLKEAEGSVKRRPWAYKLLLEKTDLELIASQWDNEKLKASELTAQAVITLAPDFPSSHLVLSKVYLLNGKYEEAILEAEKTLALDSQLSSAYYILSLAYAQIGNTEKSEENLVKTAELNYVFKDKTVILKAINLLVQKKDYKTIEKLYLQAIQIDPNDSSLYVHLAATYAKLKNKEKAIEYAKKAASLDPQKYSKDAEIFIQAIERGRWEIVGDN